tara:strand:+ start:192 stop:2468 length:2277 start_codon:yes stop_codon:yes gene_type:complete
MESIWSKTLGDNIKGEETSIKVQTLLIRTLCRKALKNDCKNTVSYKFSSKHSDSGRLYAEGGSLQNVKRQFRGLLSHNTAVDFDVVNCHPVLLLHLCRRHGISCDRLMDYVQNRNDKLTDFCESDDISKGSGKMFFLKSINAEHKILKKDKKVKIKNSFFLNFDAEMKRIQTAIVTIYKDEYKKIKRNASDNINGKLMSRIMNIEEGDMLQVACDAVNANHSVMTLAFDGLMVNKYDLSGVMIDEDRILRILENATSQWGLVWDVKEPDMSLQGFADNIHSHENVVLYAETETELVKKIYHHYYDGKFYKRNGLAYLLINHKWQNNIDTIKDHIQNTVINCHGYVEKVSKDGEVSYILLTQCINSSQNISKVLMTLVPENPRFINEVEQRAAHKISFNNGYWDFDQNRFITYKENPDYDTMLMIDRDFEYIEPDSPVRKDVFDRILHKMFCTTFDDIENLDYQVMENFLHQMGRAICGIMSDKIWFNIQGGRDSSKGVYDLLLSNSFGEYIGSFNSSSFELDSKSVSDPELKQKFLLKNRYCRMAVAHESGDKWLDGNLIKKVSSGGDRIDARNLFKNIESFQNCCKYGWWANDVPRVKPVDTLKTRWFYKMKSIFVECPETEEPLVGVVFYKKDDSIKSTFCNYENVMNAFCSILFDYYQRKDTKYPKDLEMTDDSNNDPISEAKRLFEFHETGKCPNSVIDDMYSNNKGSFDSCVHMKRILKQLGAKDFTSNGTRGLKHVKARIIDEEDEDDGDGY